MEARPHGRHTAHPSWLALAATDDARRRAYRALFRETLDPHQLETLRYGLRKGLPAGSDSFKRQIEQSLSVRLGERRVGRPSTKR